MTSRHWTRPRTRIYDANFNIGENYYRPAIDRLDRKYSGRPLSPSRQTSIPRDIAERHEKAFLDDDLDSARARAQKHISESNIFDSRGKFMASRAADILESEIDEETASKLQSIRANKKVTVIDDLDLNSTMNNIKARVIRERADKMLDTVGITAVEPPKEESVTYKRRILKMTVDSSADSDLTKWSKVDSEQDTAAAIRAKQSRARLNELEEEMNAIAEKAQVRERKAARLRALVAETAEETEAVAAQTKRIVARQKRAAIEL